MDQQTISLKVGNQSHSKDARHSQKGQPASPAPTLLGLSGVFLDPGSVTQEVGPESQTLEGIEAGALFTWVRLVHTVSVGSNENPFLNYHYSPWVTTLPSCWPGALLLIELPAVSNSKQGIIPLLLEPFLHIYPCWYVCSGKGSLNTDEAIW